MDTSDGAHHVQPLTADAEDVVHTNHSRSSGLWRVFGRRVPRSEIVFVCQMVLVYVVVAVSLFNLSRGHGTDNLWVALLGSCLGYVLPNPSIDPRPQ